MTLTDFSKKYSIVDNIMKIPYFKYEPKYPRFVIKIFGYSRSELTCALDYIQDGIFLDGITECFHYRIILRILFCYNSLYIVEGTLMERLISSYKPELKQKLVTTTDYECEICVPHPLIILTILVIIISLFFFCRHFLKPFWMKLLLKKKKDGLHNQKDEEKAKSKRSS